MNNSTPLAVTMTWGMRPNPLWNPDLEGFEDKVSTHEDWASCRAALVADGRRVNDFYFRTIDATLACTDCGHTGCSADYLEFESGFLASGGGRWAGWGMEPFPSEEASLLVESRLSARLVERALSSPELLDADEAMLIREVAGPVRARALGIPVDCTVCGGDDTTYDELLVWSFGCTPGSGRIDVARVGEADHADVKMFMRAAFDDIETRLRTRPGRRGWDVDERGFDGVEGAWFMRNERVPTFDRFLNGIGPADERNLLIDVHVVPTEPGRCMLRFWMTHPGRGYGREILVEDASESDADALAKVLEDHYEVHKRNFRWAFIEPVVDRSVDDGRKLLAQLMTRG